MAFPSIGMWVLARSYWLRTGLVRPSSPLVLAVDWSGMTWTSSIRAPLASTRMTWSAMSSAVIGGEDDR